MFYTMRLFYKISPHGLNARFVYAFHGFTLNRTFVVSVNLNKCCMHCIVIGCYCLMIAVLICLYYYGLLYERIRLAKIPTFGILAL